MATKKTKKPLRKQPKKIGAAPAYSAEDAKVLEATRKYLKECVDNEATERGKMLDDLRFSTLDQWPSDIRKERENDVENGPRPCLTIDKINQYIVQVVNDMRQGKPGINVRPQDDFADVETAKILKGLVRNIEDQSNADIAYATAGESAARVGLGFIRVTTEYVSEDSFDQEIFIRPVPNTFAVYLGRHTMPDGSDAERGYVVEKMPVEKFKAQFPKKKWKGVDFDELGDSAAYWKSDETVTVVEEYCFEFIPQELLFLADGTTMTAEDYAQWPEKAGAKPAVQERRMTHRKQLKWRKMTGVEILDSRDLPGKWIPIVEVIGREAHVNGERVLWGLVRPAKDSLRMYNYWASTLTEKFGLAPKTPFVGVVGQFATQAERWKKANRVNYSYLEYDNVDSSSGNPYPAPQRQGPTPMEAAYFQQMSVIEHDVQTSLGMFKAATGESESQQSGRAILALQRESDTGTYHFGANLAVSIRQVGRIIVDLVPHYYDTKRIVRILGEDGEVQTVTIDPEQEESMREIRDSEGIKRIYNPGVGKYDVSITVGPSYNTKRMEAAATFVELAKGAADPASAAVLRYLTVKNSDFSGSDEAAKMLRSLLPPPALEAISEKGQAIPPQAQMEIGRLNQALQIADQQVQQAGQKIQELEAGAATEAAKIEADKQAKLAALELDRVVEAEKAKLAREKAEAEFALKKWTAEQERALENDRCEHDKKMAGEKFELEKKSRADAALPDEVRVQHYKNELMQTDVMPQLMENLQAAFGQMSGALNQLVALQQQSAQVQQQTLAAIQAPQTASIGNLERDASGNISGATVNKSLALNA